MSSTTSTPHGDTLRAQSGTEENYISSQLIERNDIPGTPFTLIKTEQGYFITMGKFKLTENFQTEEESLNYITYNTYNLIMKMLAIIIPVEFEAAINEYTKTVINNDQNNNQ